MWRSLANPMACLLSAAYLTLAMFGHALHDHGPCSGGSCGDRLCAEGDGADSTCDVVATPACACAGHSVAQQSNEKANTPAEGLCQSAQDVFSASHDCLACEVLGQLKVGHSLAPSYDRTDTLDGRTIVLSESADLADEALVNGPRGPPRVA
ncbi:MAG: hypothetical protein AAF266_03865 [Planctomycetota bacterium]